MQAIKDATGARSLVCNAETAEAFSTPITPTPHEIGADRVADCGGGMALYGGAGGGGRLRNGHKHRGHRSRRPLPQRRYRAGRADFGQRAVHSRRSAAGHRAGWHRRRSSAPTRWEAVNRVSCWGGRPGGRAGAPHLRPAGLSGKRSSPRAVWRRSSSATRTIDEVNTERRWKGLRLILSTFISILPSSRSSPPGASARLPPAIPQRNEVGCSR